VGVSMSPSPAKKSRVLRKYRIRSRVNTRSTTHSTRSFTHSGQVRLTKMKHHL